MSLISRVIRSLINGVSQQSPSVRLDNQVETQDNMIPDISGILTRRSPAILDDIVAHDGSRIYDDEHAMFTMTIDEQKVSLGIKPDGTVYRFDENFADTTTLTQSASVKAYLSHTNKNSISTVETSDSILILNRDVTVGKIAAPPISTSTYGRGLIWVTSAFEGATYNVYHVNNGGTKTHVGQYTSGAKDTPKSVVKGLIDGTIEVGATSTLNMTATIPLTKTFHQENNTCIVRNDQLGYFEVDCDYGTHIRTLTESKPDNSKTLTSSNQLPPKIATGVPDTLTPTGTENFLVRINPSITEDLTTYYLRYSGEYDAWVESSNGYVSSLDNETMPVRIAKDGVATLTVEHSPFAAPLVGDDLSNPAPTILGSRIKDLIIYNSRLGFASESTLVFSTIDDYFNLYRTSTASFLISDVVDLELDSSKLGYRKIDNIFTMDNNIIINTGLSQSILAMPTNLDISAAIFAQISSFDLGSNSPTPVRRAMYFPIKQGNFTTFKSFQQEVETGVGYTDNAVTKHCEKYIKGEVVQTVISNDLVMVRTDDSPKTLYVQHTYVSENKVLQNAWHKWTFKYNIKYIYPDGDVIKIIFEDTPNNQTIYCTMSIFPSEISEDTDTQIGYIPYLDYQTEDTALALNLSDTISVDYKLGKLVPIGSPNSIQGNTFNSIVTLSEIIPRSQGQGGEQTKIGYALLMLRRMSLTVGYTGRLNIRVTRTKRVVYNHTFIPQLLGNIVVGREPVNIRDARFPVNGRSQDIEVQISTINTFTPLQILSLEWQGQLIKKGGR